jgi:signal transduction histidine kinase
LDTKLKRYQYHKLTKLVIFLMIIAAFTMAMYQLQLGLCKNLDLICLIEPNYHKSTAFYEKIDTALEEVASIAYNHEELRNVPFYYYFNSGSKEYTNVVRTERTYFEQFDRAFFYMVDGEWKSGPNSYKKAKLGHGLLDDYTAYIAFPDAYLDEKQQVWDNIRAELMPNAITCVLGLMLGLFLTIYSCMITGRIAGDTSVHLKKPDKSDTELFILALFIDLWLFVSLAKQLLKDKISIGIKVKQYEWDFIKKYTLSSSESAAILSVLTIVVSTVFVIVLLSLVRKCKAKRLLQDSFLYKLCQRLYQLYIYLFQREVFNIDSFVKNLRSRQIIFLISTILSMASIAGCLMISSWWLILPLTIEILVVVWYTKGNNSIYSHITEVIEETTRERMKSERMKVELITNVSHDLKTPLTSIISFIDLLSKENNLSEGARDYIRILQDKSERLKNIVMDLFDLAKSTSGDIKLEYDYIDLGKLITQTLADLEDRIEASELTFKYKTPEEAIHIHADGNKLYRVLLNVIDNALKYAMRKTRIHIELALIQDKAVVSIKNVAGYDMNFTAQEILQRFTRGDRARSSEGSGLGLSIAESFTRVCGGELQIELEGDMFKVYLSFDPVKPPEQITE